MKTVAPEMASPPTRVGLPPFKPLGSDASAAFGSASAGGGIPFDPIKPGSKSQKGAGSQSGVPKKGVVGWWSSQNRLTQGLLLAIVLLVPSFGASLVLLYNHVAEHHRQVNEAKQEADQNPTMEKEKASKGTGPEAKGNAPLVPSEKEPPPSQPVSGN